MVTNFAMNAEEVAFILNCRKLTSRQTQTIRGMVDSIVSAHTPRMCLVVNNRGEDPSDGIERIAST